MTEAAAERSKVRILVADDHTLLRQALCELLDFEPDLEVVAQAGSGTEAVRMAAARLPDVVILDIEMPENLPQVTVRQLQLHVPGVRIIVLSMDDNQTLVREMLSLGVHGFLHKSVSRDTLVSAIRHREGTGRRTVTISVSPESLRRTEVSASESQGALSPRELEVLLLTGRALSNRQIAKELGITEGTVKRHMHHIFEKLDAVSRIDAVNKAVARSFIQAPAEPDRQAPG